MRPVIEFSSVFRNIYFFLPLISLVSLLLCFTFNEAGWERLFISNRFDLFEL